MQLELNGPFLFVWTMQPMLSLKLTENCPKAVAPLPAPVIVPSRLAVKPKKPVPVPAGENVAASVNCATEVTFAEVEPLEADALSALKFALAKPALPTPTIPQDTTAGVEVEIS